MIHKDLCNRRHVRRRAIARKKHTATTVYGFDWYDVDGKYAKGKIHCSCGLCTYGKKYKLTSLRDMRENEKIAEALADYYDNY